MKTIYHKIRANFYETFLQNIEQFFVIIPSDDKTNLQVIV